MGGRDRFLTLDAMRGVAALAVVFYHADRSVPRGYLAVDLFFVLSGFVLFHAYAHRMDVRSFLVERLIRLGPLMVAGAATGLAINGGSPLALLMVPTGEDVLYPGNIPLWSLLFEFIAGLAFALFFRFGRTALFLCGFAGLFGVVTGILAFGSADLGFYWASFVYGLARTAFAFCAGIGIYKLVSFASVNLGPAGFILPLTLPFMVMLAPGRSADLDLFAVLLIMPFCVYLGGLCKFPSARLAGWLAVPSYALYAIHHPIVKQDYPTVATVSLSVLAAMLLAYCYDAPVRRKLTQWTRLRKVRAQSPSPHENGAIGDN